jgi:mRNA-degrading endonuclease RelE of RelBE toxin-antitoxin system
MEPTGYTVELTQIAAKVYEKISREAQACLAAGDTTNAEAKQLRILDEVLNKIIPHAPFDPSRALSGSLSNIFRVKKGRLRVCYAGASKQRRIIVLFIADTPRKEGDRSDPYSVFEKLIQSGAFDEFFEDLGQPRRNR